GFLIFITIFIFFVAFFPDFFEIAFVILPLVAPIAQKVLAPVVGPDAALIWFGVMLCVNMQTSFLHPPFGFALFYLRGVAPKEVKSSDIYWGAMPWIGLQAIMVVLVIAFPITVAAPEALEDQAALAGGDAGTTVAHAHRAVLVHFDIHRGVARGVFDRVFREIENRPLQHLGIAFDAHGIVGAPERDILLPRKRE